MGLWPFSSFIGFCRPAVHSKSAAGPALQSFSGFSISIRQPISRCPSIKQGTEHATRRRCEYIAPSLRAKRSNLFDRTTPQLLQQKLQIKILHKPRLNATVFRPCRNKALYLLNGFNGRPIKCRMNGPQHSNVIYFSIFINNKTN